MKLEDVNRKIASLAAAAPSAAKVPALRGEVVQVEQEIARLVEALARGTAYDAISAVLAAKDARLRAARAELALASAPGEARQGRSLQLDARARRSGSRKGSLPPPR